MVVCNYNLSRCEGFAFKDYHKTRFKRSRIGSRYSGIEIFISKLGNKQSFFFFFYIYTNLNYVGVMIFLSHLR